MKYLVTTNIGGRQVYYEGEGHSAKNGCEWFVWAWHRKDAKRLAKPEAEKLAKRVGKNKHHPVPDVVQV
jgi:hypothetical protein